MGKVLTDLDSDLQNSRKSWTLRPVILNSVSVIPVPTERWEADRRIPRRLRASWPGFHSSKH